MYKWNFKLNMRIEQKGSYKERGRRRNRGNEFIVLCPKRLVRVEVNVRDPPPQTWPFSNPD